MASHRYGIHGMREEHFGMAPAEMVRAGVIVWVPRGGGQMEIVGREPALTVRVRRRCRSEDFGDARPAPPSSSGCAIGLAIVSEQFSTTQFMRQVRSIVNEFQG